MDTFVGTTKDDLFIAENTTGAGAKTTASAADTLDGGKGTDTFKLYAAAPTALPTLKNIENVALYNLTAGDLDVKKWDTVETLYVVNAGLAVTATGFILGEKVTTVNFEDIAANQVVTFDKALTAATVGVNNVITNVPGPVTVKVDGTALKTLTLDASGKASNVNLTQATIETLNITGKANLTLGAASTLTAVKTIDGSKAEGKLDLDLTGTTAATLKTVKTGTGDDKLTVSINVASGTTIDLGAGNDKLVKGVAGSVDTSTTTVIDGGAGIDTLDASLVTVGNAGVFANFETLSLTSTTIIAGPPAATALDLDLLTKSTFTTIALDSGATTNTLLNVKKSQSLTVNAAAAATTLTFKASEIAGTADAYTINFNADSTAPLDAGTVGIAGIETININSVGKTGAANTIDLKDVDAKSVVITGNTNLTIEVDATKLGTVADATNGLGVSTIDASASTAGITIVAADFVDINTAWSGLTIKGGAGADSITTGATAAKALTIETGAGIDTINLTSATTATDKIIVNAGAGDDIVTLGATGGTFTLGAGKDTIDVKLAVAAGGTTVATGAIKTTITDIEKGDIIKFTAGGTFTKTDVSAATDLDSALGIASGVASGTNITWFQYAGSTYIVDNNDAAAGLHATDVIVKLNGLVDLSNSSFGGTADLTIA